MQQDFLPQSPEHHRHHVIASTLKRRKREPLQVVSCKFTRFLENNDL